VHVDLDDNHAFGNDKAATVASPEIWADTNGDGLADLSGGLIYFIGDGTHPIPYSDVMGARYGLPVPIPGSGDLVAFQIGDALAPGGGDHGTLCASAIVPWSPRSEEHTSELQSRGHLVCRLLL